MDVQAEDPQIVCGTPEHRAFIDAVGFGSDLHREIIDWFRTLPVALGLDGLRAVHACWHDTHIRTLEAALGGERMTDDFIVEATTNGTALHEAAEVVLKGPEADLNGYWYRDKDGHRTEIYCSDYQTIDPDHEPIKWDLKDPQRQTLWGAPAPRSWFEEGAHFAGIEPVSSTLAAQPIIAP